MKIANDAVLTAQDFLYKYLELKAMQPNLDTWNRLDLQGNEPRFYRYLQLCALAKALNIGTLEDFTSQIFLETKPVTDFEPIFEDMNLFADSLPFKFSQRHPDSENRKRRDIEWIFRHFFNFVEIMYNTLRFNSGWLEAGSLFAQYIIGKTDEVLSTIDQTKLKKIEQLVCLMIDAQQQSFTQGQLIQDFGYPDVDLHEIDMDNW